MKKYLFLILSGLAFNSAQSQEITSGLRFAQDNTTGTARFRAMGGAFGALGGDLSSLNTNPAGSAVFLNNQLGFSFSNSDTNNKSDYFGSRTSEKDNSFDLNQAGAVFVFNNHSPNNNWTKIALAINYEKTNNLNNSVYSTGTNTTNSVADYFLSYANENLNRDQSGMPLGEIKNNGYFQLPFADQQAFLGYEAYLINPVEDNDNNIEYTPNTPTEGIYQHENSIYSQGYNGKLSFNAATSYKDQLYIGATLNSHFSDFRKNTFFTELNKSTIRTPIDVVNTSFENEIYTYGSGFSFQLGLIGKLNDQIRLGLSYHSPIWNKLNDELRQFIYSTGYNFGDPPNPSLTITDIDSNEPIIYRTYRLRTPGKITGSFAYVFSKKGLISFDYGYKDYGNIKYSIEEDSRNRLINSDISNALKGVSEVRVGGEYKIERLSLRAGYHFEGSPYKDNKAVGNLNSYSTGLGYNFGGTRADISYAYTKRNSQQAFFSQGFTDGAKINSINNTVTFSLLFEL